MSLFDKYDLEDVCGLKKSPDRPSSGLTVIVGGSGTGKTTILKDWGFEFLDFDLNTPIYKLFVNEQSAEKYLISAGLRSIPSWKRSLTQVSNGERHRAEIALQLSAGVEIVDEFTSVVDRNTAMALCHSINKNKPERLALATCHKDVLEWLDFDHAYDTDSGQWLDRGSVRRDRQLKISIMPCATEKVWEMFRRHHYLSGKINKSANSWVAMINENPVAMVSVIAFPNGNWKDGWREHRTVVLPEFQGMGIGSSVSDYVAKMIISTGARYFSKTAHPAFGEHRNNSLKWRATSKNMKKRDDYNSNRKTKTKEDGHKANHAHRVCYSHEFIGD